MNEPIQPTPADAPMPVKDKKGLAIASLVLGIVSLCLAVVPIVGLIVALVGLILGILGLKSSMKGMAIAGIVLSAIVLVLAIIAVAVIGSLSLLGPVIGNVFSDINSSLVSP